MTMGLGIVLMFLISTIDSLALPPNCDSQPVAETDSCIYGTTQDLCGRTVCLKGPGEMCGGRFGRYGRCADGLMCSNCNRCQGCSFQVPTGHPSLAAVLLETEQWKEEGEVETQSYWLTFICWDDKDCIY